MDNFDLRKFLAEGKLFENVSDYADRIMGAGVDDPIGLIDFYDDNIEELPEPMDPKIFKANIDAIKAKVSEYQKMMGEGKLHEAMAPQDVVDIADTVAEEFTKESADAGEFLVYSVGRMEADDMSFELDTDVTSQTPKNIDTRGVGEGWGGIFRIKPTKDGYEVRNAEKGGLVAMIDNAGNFRMLSAAESRDELYGEPDVDWKNDEPDFNRYMEEGEITEDVDMIPAEKLFALIARDLQFSPLVQDGAMLSKEDAIEIMRHVIAIEGSDISAEAALGEYIASGDLNEEKETKSNKMKKSELKEMIKAAMLEDARTDAEQEGYKDGFEDAKDDIEDKLKDMKVSEAEDVDVEKDVDVDVEDDENVDVDIEKDIEVDDKESEVDVDIKASMPGESEDVEEVQALLMKAQEAAEALDDEKLTDQIGNTITYFTRSHVARNVSEADLDMDLSVGDRAEEAEIGLEEAVSGDQEVILKGEFKANDETFNKLSDYKKGMKVVMRRAGMDMAKDYDRYAGVIDSIDQGRNEIVFTNAKGTKMALDPADAVIVTNWGGPNESLNESVMFPMWNKIK